jgi:hypothetical protein
MRFVLGIGAVCLLAAAGIAFGLVAGRKGASTQTTRALAGTSLSTQTGTESRTGEGSNSTPLCADIGSISGATATRVNPFPSNKWIFTFPADSSITGAAQARALASTICRLPRFPGGLPCPADFGVNYAIRFAPHDQRVSINPTGCETITGAGPERWVRSTGFWPQFGRTIGLAHATNATFRGRLISS